MAIPSLGRAAESQPVYTGPLTGIVSEGDDIGTLVLTLSAKVEGGGNVTYNLIVNPADLFELDAISGEIRTARAIDRESAALNGFLSMTIRATSNPSGQSIEQVLMIIVQDVNDEPPRFSQNEYFALIHENLPSGTPLSGLNIVATDRDSVSFFSFLFIFQFPYCTQDNHSSQSPFRALK